MRVASSKKDPASIKGGFIFQIEGVDGIDMLRSASYPVINECPGCPAQIAKLSLLGNLQFFHHIFDAFGSGFHGHLKRLI